MQQVLSPQAVAESSIAHSRTSRSETNQLAVYENYSTGTELHTSGTVTTEKPSSVKSSEVADAENSDRYFLALLLGLVGLFAAIMVIFASTLLRTP